MGLRLMFVNLCYVGGLERSCSGGVAFLQPRIELAALRRPVVFQLEQDSDDR
jgi:hypothetical protein